MTEHCIAKIFPGPIKTSQGLTYTTGTKVMVGDVALAGVNKIVITAALDNVWRAEIHCIVQPPDELIVAANVVVAEAAPAEGDADAVELTHMGSETKEFGALK